MRRVISWLMIFGLCLLSEQAAAAGTVLTLVGQPQQIAPGETLTLTADLVDVQNLYGFELHLRFDPSVLQLVPDEAGKAGTPGALLDHDFVAVNAFDNAKGTVDYAATQISPHEPVSGSGSLLEMKFAAVAPGMTRVEVGSLILADIDGLALAATTTPAEVTITGSSVRSDTPATPTSMVPSAGVYVRRPWRIDHPRRHDSRGNQRGGSAAGNSGCPGDTRGCAVTDPAG